MRLIPWRHPCNVETRKTSAYTAKMSSRSSPLSSFSSSSAESDSDNSSKGISDHAEQDFIPYDEDLEPVATQEESMAYEETVARQEEEALEYQRRFNGEIDVNTWYLHLWSLVALFFHVFAATFLLYCEDIVNMVVLVPNYYFLICQNNKSRPWYMHLNLIM